MKLNNLFGSEGMLSVEAVLNQCNHFNSDRHQSFINIYALLSFSYGYLVPLRFHCTALIT